MAQPQSPLAEKKAEPGYVSPVLRPVGLKQTIRLEALPLRKAAAWSVGLHVLGPPLFGLMLVGLLMLLSWLLGINWLSWFQPKPERQDLVFTIVSDTQAKPPEKPLFKGAHNQRAGGAKVAPPAPAETYQSSPLAKPSKAETAAVAPAPQSTPKPVEAAPKAAKKAELPRTASAAPVPLLKDAEAGTEAGETGGQEIAGASGTSGGDSTGSAGSPGVVGGSPQGGPGAPGVDVVQEVDFGPFMADLTRRIKRNWQPPRGSESRKVKVIFYLARDGKLLKSEIQTPSGDEYADRAAIAAIEQAAPFLAFPPQVREDILPVEFTFDYNVLNSKHGKKR